MKSVLDLPGPARTTVYVLLYNGAIAGSVVCALPANGDAKLSALVRIYAGPLTMPATSSSATGYGYCKQSAAVDDVFNKVSKLPTSDETRTTYGFTAEVRDRFRSVFAGGTRPDLHGSGMSAVGAWVESHGYKWEPVL